MTNIDINIFNALNLINPSLGKAYRQKGYNPFDDEFVLQNDYVKSLLIKAKDKYTIKTEDFLKKGNKEVAEMFGRACKNTEELLTDLSTHSLENKTKQLKEIIVFLKNRKELLSQATKKLKNEKENSFGLYRDIVGIDVLLSEIVKDTFFENFNKNNIIENFLKYCQTDKKQKSQKQQENIQTQKILYENAKQTEKDSDIQQEQIVEVNIIKPNTYKLKFKPKEKEKVK